MKQLKHVAINTRFLLPGGLEGMGRFTEEIVKRWVKDHPEVEFSFFFDRTFDPKYIYGPNVHPYVINPPARHPLLFWLWFEMRLPAMMRRLKPDVFFSPDGFLSLRTNTPQVPVFHDLAFMRFPQDVKKSEAWFYHRYFPMYAEKAKHILAVSEYTRQDIVKQFGTAANKISVVGNACPGEFRIIGEDEKQSIRDQFSKGKPYFYFVGAIQPRKNLSNLIRAFDILKKKGGKAAEMQLVLVGRKAWNFEEIIHSYRESVHKNDIHFTGYVPDNDLNRIAGASEALCYVSLFEGFGIPLLEAMHSGTAVICSNNSSMPEVAGDAALEVDAKNPESIAHAMQRMIAEPGLRESLIHKGNIRKQAYTWEASAAKAWEALEKAIN